MNPTPRPIACIVLAASSGRFPAPAGLEHLPECAIYQHGARAHCLGFCAHLRESPTPIAPPEEEVASVSPYLPADENPPKSSRRRGRKGWGKQGALGKRRRRLRDLGFETLEDRRVMAAVIVGGDRPGEVPTVLEVTEYSTSSVQGLLQALNNELAWANLSAQSGLANPAPFALPNDPLLSKQWHLLNTGQQVGSPDFQPIFGAPGEDINVLGAWELGYTGEGVVVAVFDSGVQMNHPDLAANIHPTLQFDGTVVDGVPPNANPNITLPPTMRDPISGILMLRTGSHHGTAVAGEIAAVADNGIGGAGVSPDAQIVPVKVIGEGTLSSRIAQAFRFATTQDIDITNNSWGPGLLDGRALRPARPDELLAIRDSIFFGRDGLGVIHVFASGNEGNAGFNDGFPRRGLVSTSSYNGYINTRYTIGVTGVDHDGGYNNIDGTVTAYPETGASVLVAAPTGSNASLHRLADDARLGSGIVTTDLSGTLDSGFGGSNVPPSVTDGEYDRDFLADTDYTSRFNGTSAAAPLVSGVVALMLDANPQLSWRDVQEILVRSARQNAQFEVPTNGLGQGLGFETQNTWITNQFPLFQDPDRFDPQVPPLILTFAPTSDPNAGPNHRVPQVARLTNAAGYTVSQGTGIYGEQTGYGHGTVDATLAVQLAAQWHTRNQNLPPELSFTTAVNRQSGPGLNIPAGVQLSEAAGQQIVPGGLFGADDFATWWESYFSPEGPPDLRPIRGNPLVAAVPPSNTMSIESVDVRLSISGGTAEALDHLRITLVSPEGTQSELNHFWVEPFDGLESPQVFRLQTETPATKIGEPGSVAIGEDGNLVFTFNTNRVWGERSDTALIINPLTKEPVRKRNFFAGDGALGPLGGVNARKNTGEALEQGWELHIENYGPTSLGMQGMEIVWHGSPIAANTKRVQGFIGIDQNQDDLFNYERTLAPEIEDFIINGTLVGDPTILQDFDPTTIRQGEIRSRIDPTQEKFAANIRVIARRASDNLIVDEFVTGADGNYYFDLVPDEYIISVEDPLGRTAVDDSLTPSNLLPNYRNEWRITADYFQAWDYDENLEVPIDPATGAPFPWLTGPSPPGPGGLVGSPGGLPVASGVKNINFLLDPGPADRNEAVFSGTIIADFNGDGQLNGEDYAVPGITVYVDINQNGRFDPGEIAERSGAGGAYSLNVPINTPTLLNIGVIAPAGWTVVNPADGLLTFFVRSGSVISTADFAIRPPVGGNSGNPVSTQPGLITGLVFDDLNKNSLRDTNETGVASVRVYLDNNNSGTFDAGDRETATTSNGSYVFSEVAPGNYRVRVDVQAPLTQTRPALGQGYNVTLLGGGTLSGLQFGLNNAATLDYGDLPAPYPTTLAQNGARHGKSAYFLGASVDTEFDGRPTSNPAYPQGDNTVGSDENGVIVNALVAGSTGSLVATASRHGGYLQGWMDFNNDGDFNDAGERIITNKLLEPGANSVNFAIPGVIVGSNVYARFRYGEFGINAVTGAAQIGEVEDYALAYAAPAPAVQAGYAGDFNNNASVDGFDFLAWQRGAGTASAATRSAGDANRDGDVDGGDLTQWTADFGQSTPVAAVAAAPVTGDFDLNGQVDGFDFLRWQSQVGAIGASRNNGDGDGDGVVGQVDHMIWESMFGGLGASSAASAGNAATSLLPISISEAAVASFVWETPSTSPNAAVNASPNASQLSGIARRTDFAFGLGQAEESSSKSENSPEDELAVALAGEQGGLRRGERLFDDWAAGRRRAEFGSAPKSGPEHDEEEDRAAAFEQLADEQLWVNL